MSKLRIYACNNFRGHYPAGTSAIMIAKTREDAAELLEQHLMKQGLSQLISTEQIFEIDSSTEQAVIFSNGDY